MVMLNASTATSVGIVVEATKENAKLNLRLPICADSGQRVSISRRFGARWKLIGYGVIN